MSDANSKPTKIKSPQNQKVINNRDIKGLFLQDCAQNDQLLIQMVYLVDSNVGQGFLVLTETAISLEEILDKQGETFQIEMIQK